MVVNDAALILSIFLAVGILTAVEKRGESFFFKFFPWKSHNPAACIAAGFETKPFNAFTTMPRILGEMS